MRKEGSKASNDLDKSIPVHLKLSRKIYICVFSELIFWQFSEQIKNLFRISSFRSGFCSSTTSVEPNNTIFLKKVILGCFEKNFWVKMGELCRWTFR